MSIEALQNRPQPLQFKIIHMPNRQIAAERAVQMPRAQRLAATSTLFEVGDLSEEISDRSFILRLNTIVARRLADAEKNTPANLSDAILSNGKLHRHAELAVFGRWLLLDGYAWVKKQGGKQPDPRVILQCVAIAMYELRVRPKLQEHGLAHATRESRKREITKRDLALRWEGMFGDLKNPSFFDARLRSIRRILPAYLEHLKTGAYVIDSKQIRKSPEIKRVLEAISRKNTPRPEVKVSVIAKPVTLVPADPPPFDIELRYSSPAQENEYRNLTGISLPPSQLRYKPTSVSSTSTSGTVRADRKDKIVLVPDVAMRDTYQVEALIDRLVLLVITTTPTAAHYLNDKIFNATGSRIFAHDLKKQINRRDWRASLPQLDSTKPLGHHFAILIQDPTPELLPSILDVIRGTHGIDGDVNFHLIEVTVDFYPRTRGLPEEAILFREKMVGLLQRHHWAKHSLFHSHGLPGQRRADARQFYLETNNNAKTVFFFAKEKKTISGSDHDLDDPEVRTRLLTTRPGRDLYLNSTTWKGAENSASQVSIQHKIANRRNPEKQTKEDLPDQERRARIEVTISGDDTLRKEGLDTVIDLASASFRKLAMPFLSFKLAEIEPFQHILDDAQIQMRTRGVYGIELRNRARALEEREERRRGGQKMGRKNDLEGRGLVSWKEMNDVVGKALDELQRRWTSFSWK
ncbi:hypothetical protein [Ruegeria arenilitoris]|uniref:hypothetical protein n=1 Tax=Ruegeria arenilitoris TaxID=1173585 RepID=UPI001CFE97A3|nr:hypothetical protein [Ruegeria arenilitoris]